MRFRYIVSQLKYKRIVRKVKKTKSTQWFSLHVSADNAYSEYKGLLKTLTILVEESGRLDSR